MMEAALDDDGANATAAEPDEQGVTEREVDLVEGAAADDDPDPEDLAQAAMEAEESDEEADDEWRLVCLKRPDDVTIEYSDFEQFFFGECFHGVGPSTVSVAERRRVAELERRIFPPG
jgi:hypothetical protein